MCKPVITPCGHLFCFWCGHKSMSFIGASACPLCRFEYAKFPRLCGALHEFLGRAFPGEYRARLAALDEDEAEMQQQSPQPAAGAAPAATVAEIFRCVRCAGLLFEPVALNCGHLACLACCAGDALAGGDPMARPRHGPRNSSTSRWSALPPGPPTSSTLGNDSQQLWMSPLPAEEA